MQKKLRNDEDKPSRWTSISNKGRMHILRIFYVSLYIKREQPITFASFWFYSIVYSAVEEQEVCGNKNTKA